MRLAERRLGLVDTDLPSGGRFHLLDDPGGAPGEEGLAEAADRYGVGWRQAGQAVAIARVAEAARLRSVYP